MTPLLCSCEVVNTLETRKCQKKAPRFVEINFLRIRNRQKRFSQNEERQLYKKVASKFLILPVDCYDLSKFSDDFTPFFRL